MATLSTLTPAGALPAGFERFAFVAEALEARGGFAPYVEYALDEAGLLKPYKVRGRCHLIPYPRESMTKFAARAAVAVYENHLASACERFVGYLAKHPPLRANVDGPLARAFVEDADWRGNSLDIFWQGFMRAARARGTMLLLVDMPREVPETVAQQVEARRLPYITALEPELVREYELDLHGRFRRVAIASTATVAGETKAVLREWDELYWRVRDGDIVLEEGEHAFGRCPVIAFTESGSFPCYGSFEQIATLSKRIFNAQSELDEILRSQTFSILPLQVPPEQMATFDAAKVAAVVGTHNLLIYSGERPEFIAPPDGPATVYMARIAALEESIRRIGLTLEEPRSQAAESGLALQIRFQSLNAALAQFALRMQDLERQVWDLFAAAVRTENRVEVMWPTDYSLSDVRAELEVLTAMQASSFPEAVLREKRRQIVQLEFAGAEQAVMDEMLDAIAEPAAEVPPPQPVPAEEQDDPPQDEPAPDATA